MLKIAVCDDDLATLDALKGILTNFCKERETEVRILLFNDGIELLKSEDSFDLLFLDIEMKYSNGIEIAQQIRHRDMNVPIIYITSYSDYWRRAYKVHAFDYILKPIKCSDINRVMKDFFTAKADLNDEIITFNTDDGVACFTASQIYYFLYESKKKVFVYSADGKTVVRENLSDIYSRLNKELFYQTRRDCIINLKYVKRIQNEYVIIMKDDNMLPLAQKKRDDFVKRLSDLFVETLKGKNV